jgi:arsenate reductase (glutaredoxin)
MLKIYHNPRCKKSCEGLKYLQNKKVDFETVKYLEKGLTKAELKEILLKLNLKPHEIMRKQEEYYKKELKGKKFNDDEWIKILIENPKLLQRPIIVGKYKAVIAQPPEMAELVIN